MIGLSIRAYKSSELHRIFVVCRTHMESNVEHCSGFFFVRLE